jgi:hypothetical protein
VTNTSNLPMASANDGTPKSQWQEGFFLRFADPESGQVYSYSAVSSGGRGAIGDLLNQYARKRSNPYVMLANSWYKHKQFGKVFTPKFVITGFETSAPALSAPMPSRGGLTISSGKVPAHGGAPANLTDDGIPF